LKVFERNAELTEDLEEQRRADFPTAMERDRHAAALRMAPALMTSGLSRFFEAEFCATL
jgi:hypothetical protein